ncbi:hypothetical protein FQN58_09610 [Bacteroides xylanisolvens]|uniref:Uncharacterized protein n=1 Tax=Bacteroides ovatus TaxID=28116 RepID=A0A414WSV0_BACOV|nr:hypothetical protein FQN58_09610 [Bacteroides xylanisolvens]RHH40874.1 hypothetical protein DW206_21820 [Bacteroides ovatus]
MLVNNVQRYSNPGIESQVCLNFMPVSVVSSIKIVRNRDFPIILWGKSPPDEKSLPYLCNVNKFK